MSTTLEQLRPLTPLTPLAPLGGTESSGSVASEVGALADETLFGTIFRNAIENVKETDAEKTEAQYLLSTGQLDNPASLMLSMYKYQVSTSLLIQLRSRAQDIYSELTRMSL